MTVAPLLGLVWRRRWAVLILTGLGLAAAASSTALVPRTWTSTSFIRIDAGQGVGSAFETTQVNQILLRTYAELLATRQVAEQVADELGPGWDAASVRGGTTVVAVERSELIAIEARASSPKRARALATAYARDGLRVVASSTSNPKAGLVAQPGELPGSPSSPRPALNLAVGGLLSLLAALGGAVLLDRADTRLRDTSGAVLHGMPVIGRLKRMTHDAGPWREPVLKLMLARGSRPPGSIALIPVSRLADAHDSAVGLARALAQIAPPLLLVQRDTATAFAAELPGGGNSEHGSSSDAFPNPSRRVSSLVRPTKWQGVHILPWDSSESPDLLNSSALLSVHGKLCRDFAGVVYLCPPLSDTLSALALAPLADTTLLTVTRRDRVQDVLDATASLAAMGARFEGLVVVELRSRPGTGWRRRSEGSRTRRSRGRRVRVE